MTIDEASKELASYMDVMLELESLAELSLRLNNSNKLKAIRYDLDKIKSSNHSDLSDSIVKLESLKNLYSSKILENLDLISKIENKINKINNPIYRLIIRKKYIQGHKLEYVSAVIDRSLSHTKVLHRNAIYVYSKLVD
jgi:hypothetical protein